MCVCVCVWWGRFQNFLSPSRTCSINPPPSCLCGLSQPLFHFLPTHRGRFVCPKKSHPKISPLFLQLLCSFRLLGALTPEFVAKPSPSTHSVRSPCEVPCPLPVPHPSHRMVAVQRIRWLGSSPSVKASTASSHFWISEQWVCGALLLPLLLSLRWNHSSKPFLLASCPGHPGQLLPHQDVHPRKEVREKS